MRGSFVSDGPASSQLTDFEGGESEGGEGGGEEPEPDDDLWLTPAGQVEVMMYWRAPEKSFSAGVFEIRDLQDHAH